MTATDTTTATVPMTRLYVMESGGHTKIGLSRLPEQRAHVPDRVTEFGRGSPALQGREESAGCRNLALD